MTMTMTELKEQAAELGETVAQAWDRL